MVLNSIFPATCTLRTIFAERFTWCCVAAQFAKVSRLRVNRHGKEWELGHKVNDFSHFHSSTREIARERARKGGVRGAAPRT